MSDAWSALRMRWWEGWTRFFPEDAGSLGVRSHAPRLRGQHGAVGDEENAFHRDVLIALRAFDRAKLDANERLEHEAMTRSSAFRAHVLAADHDRSCLELSLYPHAMIAHHLAHAQTERDRDDVRARLAALPGVLSSRERALREGLARGYVPDRAIVAVLTEFALPGAERAYRASGDVRAAEATAQHRAFVERELGPRSEIGAARLGEEELTTRLALTYGEVTSPRVIRDEARESLSLLSARLVVSAAHAARARELRVRDLREAHAYVALLFRETLSGDPRDHFRALIDRATSFAAERHLFSAPSRLPDFVPIPDGMIHGGAITNWPAPLCDRTRSGHVALALDPAAHSVAFAPGLAIHEATPGHYLQSAAWQALSIASEPVRFVAVHDDVASASSFFGAMPSVEGFAVHAEEVMFDAGFFDRDSEVASIASAIIRAARAVIDMSLHLRELVPEQASEELHALTGMPRGWCANQVVRFLRIPMQATTYFVGARRHRAMMDDARVRRGAAFRADEFHDALLALGPASLGTLAARLRGG